MKKIILNFQFTANNPINNQLLFVINDRSGNQVNGLQTSGTLVTPNADIESNKFRSSNHILIDGTKAFAGVQVTNGALIVGLYDNAGSSGNKFLNLQRGISVRRGFVGVGTAIMSDFDGAGYGVYADQNSLIGITRSNIFGATDAVFFDGSLLFCYSNTFEQSTQLGQMSWLTHFIMQYGVTVH